MVTDNVGTWAVECEVNDHLNAGLKATYTVNQCDAPKHPTYNGVTRTFFVGIVETDWDYAENNRSLIHGYDLDTNEK